MSFDTELARLRTENHTLAEELAQCQADKEFVWSLWKRLQVANPDITQAVALVVQREKDKAELKDRKVLDILANKDERIEELQKVLANQSKELTRVLNKKLEMQNDVTKSQEEFADLKSKYDELQEKVADVELRNKDRQDIVQQLTSDLSKQKSDLENKEKKMKEEVATLEKDKADLSSIRDGQKKRIENLEIDLKELSENYDKTCQDRATFERQIQQYEKKVSDITLDLNHKCGELESVRKELSDLWDTHTQTNEHCNQQTELIKQLQALQFDTQKMMKNQEDTHSLETSSVQSMYNEMNLRYKAMMQTESELRNQLGQYHQRVQELEEQSQVSVESKDQEVQVYDSIADTEMHMHDFQKEINILRERLNQKDVDEIKTGFSEPVVSSTPNRSRSFKRRSLSSSPQRQMAKTDCRLKYLSDKLESTRTELKLKTAELETVRGAHNRRLQRLKSLQQNYRLLKQEKELDREEKGVPKKKKVKLRKSDPKSLQQEDSDTVWNELAYHRRENKHLVVENMNLEEEVDNLKVRTAQDAATIHELKTCLEQEREELQFIIEQQEEDTRNQPPEVNFTPKQLAAAKNKVQGMRRKCNELQEKLNNLNIEHKQTMERQTILMEEKKKLRRETNGLKEQLADWKIENTDLKKDLLSLRREFRKRKSKGKNKTAIAKQYQKVLNKSITSMKEVFGDLENDDWEEVSDESEISDTIEPVDTTESLGQTIVEVAQSQRLKSPERQRSPSPSHSTPKRHKTPPIEIPKSEFLKNIQRTQRNRRKSKAVQSGIYRDTASSPIPWEHTDEKALTQGNAAVGVLRPKTSSGVSSFQRQQMSILRQRVSSLQKQVVVLKTAKNNSNKKCSEVNKKLVEIQADLQLSNQKLQTAKLSTQRQACEIERLKMDKENLEHQIDNNSSINTTKSHTEEEYISLQARFKSISCETSKQLQQIKDMKAENSTLSDKVKQLQDKVNHCERDLSQKRTLMDDVRLKLKIAEENATSDASVLTDLETKQRNLTELNQRYKTQIESFRTRLSAVTREKYENEEKVLRLSDEIEKKAKQASELQKKNGQLQKTVAELDQVAQEQLHALADQSQTAISATQSKLVQANNQVHQMTQFIKIFGHALLNSVKQARQMISMKQEQREKSLGFDGSTKSAATIQMQMPASLHRAQQVARNILNISQSELEDLISPGDSEQSVLSETESTASSSLPENTKVDRRWLKKWQKILATNKDDMAINLVEIFMEKVEERCRLAAEVT